MTRRQWLLVKSSQLFPRDFGQGIKDLPHNSVAKLRDHNICAWRAWSRPCSYKPIPISH